MQIITSKENQLVKHICKLKEKKYRTQYNEFIVEGVKLVKEAIKENAKIKKIVISKTGKESKLIEKYLGNELEKINYVQVEDNIFKLISEVENPQGILAVIQKKFEKNEIKNEEIIVALDGLQDPGNLGTILRTVDSVGLSQIVLSEKTADPYNPKVVRSTMGAIFRLNIIQSNNIIEDLKKIKKNRFKLLATSLENSESIYNIDLNKKAIIIGNEANGVSKEVFDIVDEKTKIPMLGKTESLNAAVATGVILYEYVRRKV